MSDIALRMATRLFSPARRASAEQRLAMLPRLEKASKMLARAGRVLLDRLAAAEAAGDRLDVAALWAAVERIAPRAAVVDAVLEALHRALGRRDVYARPSHRWADPRALLLEGDRWAAIREDVLAGLSLTVPAPTHLARQLITLDALVDPIDGTYQRRTNRQLTVQESRHRLARKICHGNRGQIRQAYREGQEDQLAALGLVLNAVVLWNTRYLDAIAEHLRSAGRPVREEDVARLSPLGHAHLNCLGRYAFTVQAPAGLRPLRDPTARDVEDDEF